MIFWQVRMAPRKTDDKCQRMWSHISSFEERNLNKKGCRWNNGKVYDRYLKVIHIEWFAKHFNCYDFWKRGTLNCPKRVNNIFCGTWLIWQLIKFHLGWKYFQHLANYLTWVAKVHMFRRSDFTRWCNLKLHLIIIMCHVMKALS